MPKQPKTENKAKFLVKEITDKVIKVCNNCPELGNHYHLDGDLFFIEDDRKEVIIQQIKGCFNAF